MYTWKSSDRNHRKHCFCGTESTMPIANRSVFVDYLNRSKSSAALSLWMLPFFFLSLSLSLCLCFLLFLSRKKVKDYFQQNEKIDRNNPLLIQCRLEKAGPWFKMIPITDSNNFGFISRIESKRNRFSSFPSFSVPLCAHLYSSDRPNLRTVLTI